MLLTLAVIRRLYLREEERAKDDLEIAAFRSRITRSHIGGDAIVQLWHEKVGRCKKGGRNGSSATPRHPAALFMHLRETKATARRAERARELAHVAQYSPSESFSTQAQLNWKMTPSLLPSALSTRLDIL